MRRRRWEWEWQVCRAKTNWGKIIGQVAQRNTGTILDVRLTKRAETDWGISDGTQETQQTDKQES